ncbi:hypothetical protein F0365_09745 [Nonlabens sp. Ci31]|uniref:DUF6090 family protein n=1 Tax=Nonlabens sp. Ci31 TaxID=2608253 RepID=UPI001463057E|nr:DUF6090 family protein [Nonlabens sp. Ci31]QJP34655.1 hypothetical protein F0365_09745 [Nonlabens sp. Ci31]
MTKLFRSIRKNLLNEGKTTKYFKYAIGEIVLVVIGIMIALSINNWNKQREDRESEKTVISNLKRSLINTERQLEQVSSDYKRNLENMDFITNHLNSRLPLSNELKEKWISVESYPEPLFEIGIYENFKNNSLHLIQNDSLKTAIIQFYEAQLPSLSEKLTGNIETISNVALIPLNVQNFTYGGGQMNPNDYELLLDNQQYLNAVSYMRGIKAFTSSAILQLRELLKSIVDAVTKYQNEIK